MTLITEDESNCKKYSVFACTLARLISSSTSGGRVSLSCPFADDFLVLLVTPPPPLVLPELKMDFQALVVLLLLTPPPDPLEPELEEPEEELQPLLLEVASRGVCKVWVTNTIVFI